MRMFPKAAGLFLGVTLAGAAMLSGASARADDALNLRYQWKSGDTMRVRLTTDSSTEVTVINDMDPGKTGQFKGQRVQVSDIRLTVKGVDADGVATLGAVFESTRMNRTQSNMEELAFDTANPAGAKTRNPIAAALTAMIGKEITLKIDPNGTVQSASGTEAIRNAIPPSEDANPNTARVASGLKESINDDVMRRAFDRVLSGLAGKSVKPGETWSRRTQEPQADVGELTVEANSSADGADAQAQCKVTSKLTFAVADPAKAAADKTEKPKMAELIGGVGKGESVITFDAAHGRIVKSTYTRTLALKMPPPTKPAQSAHIGEKTATDNCTLEVLGDGAATPAPAAAPAAPKAP